MTTNLTENALERRIIALLTGAENPDAGGGAVNDAPGPAYGAGWQPGNPADYDREYCVDVRQLAAFLQATQPEAAAALDLGPGASAAPTPARRKFLARLQKEISEKGTAAVFRNGLKHGPRRLDLYYARATPGNETAAARHRQNRFTAVRQLHYSAARPQASLDLALSVNGLPVATFELKNRLTGQTAQDAIAQYQKDRDPREALFQVGRCLAHFAVDEDEAYFCTKLSGPSSRFLPFHRGRQGGGGNPPNPNGLRTDYLWREIFARDSLADLLENYAWLTGETAKDREQLWPRYHQLDVVRKLLAEAAEQGSGRRYLIQHSAGSGKSNSIAWLAHRLSSLPSAGAAGRPDGGIDEAPGGVPRPVFDSVIVVTDRVLLDRQIRDAVGRFAQVSAWVGHAESAAQLRRFLEGGKKIIITTVQKFPYIIESLGRDHRGRRFAVIIDEAHSGQGGRGAAKMAAALSETYRDPAEGESLEDQLTQLAESRRLPENASYFAFTATPKNKTLELFGQPHPPAIPGSETGGGNETGDDSGNENAGGEPGKRYPFHSYTMQQAIEEGFILDVLACYASVRSYYNLIKRVADDPKFDSHRAPRKLRRYVESHQYTIRQKAGIMVEHFLDEVMAARPVGGQGRAMVVTGGIKQALDYYQAINELLAERGRPYRALVAFSGEHDYGGGPVSEAGLNGFPDSDTAQRFREEDEYRLLVCADKFQTGYDEPLLCAMYVDKPLAGVQAVQTLSRLNRRHPQKSQVFILDFVNEAEAVRAAFAPYYRGSILAEETDPDRLHDLQAELDGRQLYTDEEVDQLAAAFLDGAGRHRLDPILDACVERYGELDEDGQVQFKGRAKAFTRTYAFLSQILTYAYPPWEKLCIFLDLLLPKLPAPAEDDLSRGILETVSLESYRAERQAVQSIRLDDADEAEIAPVPPAGQAGRPEPELDALSEILRQFNDLFGNIPWTDRDHIARTITKEIPRQLAADTAYLNACRHATPHTDDEQKVRIQLEKSLQRIIAAMYQNNMQLLIQYQEHPEFQEWLKEAYFNLTYPSAPGFPDAPQPLQ